MALTLISKIGAEITHSTLVSCYLHNKEIVETLLDHGANINNTGYVHLTPLHVAILAHDSDLTLYLIKRGANIEASAGESQQTPLHSACKIGNKQIVQSLIENGAKVNAETTNGLTPLILLKYAQNKKQNDAIEALLLTSKRFTTNI